MINYGKTLSLQRPEITEVKENAVFIASNIRELTVNVPNPTNLDETETGTVYEYNLVSYTKDEYIAVLNEQLADAQLAICELYEGMM